MIIAQWFLSKTVRHATAMCGHVRKLLNHQRDVLKLHEVEEVESAMRLVKEAIASKADKAKLMTQMEHLETVATKWVRPYPHAAWRENVEVLLVALAVALGIRTFFLQPFKIPTGSMQPTLWGVTSENLLAEKPDFKIPSGLSRLRDWALGTNYVRLVAKAEGELEDVGRPWPPAVFSIFQGVKIGGKWRVIWFPPDYGNVPLEKRADLRKGQAFRPGDEIIKLRVKTGDHLFVDRVTYNFRPPQRGEIIVFETKGIPEDRRVTPLWNIPPDQFYIKRLVGLGGETIQIGDDRHLVIDGRRLDASRPHFENLYSFDPMGRPRDSVYSGHVNQKVSGQLVPRFVDGSSAYRVEPDHLIVMGDNTMNSLDSRFWGEFPSESVIGRSGFVYWPISSRFGWTCIFQ
jgi:signal peptidase I